MVTIGHTALWHDIGIGLLLTALVLVAAEMLARYIEADAARRAGSLGRAAQITAIHAVVAEEFR